ncbi:MAG: outer membrane beta-barrel protein [Bryobacteraceae bacterium]
MKTIQLLCVAALVLAPSAFAQKWEFGGGVGGGFYTSETVTSPSGSAGAKFNMGVAGSAWLGNTNSRRLGGELRYDYQMGDMHLGSNGTTANFGAQTHAVHYDILLQPGSSEGRVRPFVAFGGGIKVYRGTGAEQVYQPLEDIALLTKVNQIEPLVSAGAGLKFRFTNRINFRLEVHDYLTPFPRNVIAPAQNAKVGGWLQDIVPMFGISFLL